MIRNNVELNDTLKRLYSRLKRQVFIQELSNKGLVFIYGNDKLKNVYTFSLPAGWSCPGASACLSRADRHRGGVTDGPDCQFRCFAASEECRLTEVRMIRWHNFDLLKKCDDALEMAALIAESLPKDAKIVRTHVSGDFYSQAYFEAWMEVAAAFPEIIFYAYTKSIPTLLKFRNLLPSNFRITASMGSRYDNLIVEHNLNRSVVVKTEAEAQALGLEIDDDDSHAQAGDASFALLIHAPQPKGTEWATAWEAIRHATVVENKAKGPKRVYVQPTTAQWLERIFRMVGRLLKAGGRLEKDDEVLVGILSILRAAQPTQPVGA